MLALTAAATLSLTSANESLSSLPLVPRSLKCPSRPKTSVALNQATTAFLVDGERLPFVHFDIGETYSGYLPIDHNDNKYFFWYATSSNINASDEILIWLNGGPGASSLDGFLHANGNFIWQQGSHAPVSNTWAWSNLTNVVWVDQPIGTGYSNGIPNVSSQEDVAKFFLAFWKHFVDLFDLHDRKVYIAGESYGGKYVPYLAQAMLDEHDTKYFNLSGILLYNPGIGDDAVQSQIPLADYAKHHALALGLNSTFINYLEEASANCGFDTYTWFNYRFPSTGSFGYPPSYSTDRKLSPGCNIFTDLFFAARKVNPCFNVYQINQACPIPFDPIGFPYSAHWLPPTFPRPYFDLPTVKSALHVPWNYDWKVTSEKSVFLEGVDTSMPSTFAQPGQQSAIQGVIEATNNVIIANGDLDMAVPTNGTLLALQNTTWNGAQGFTSQLKYDLWVPKGDEYVQECIAGSGVMGRWSSERGLTFARVFLAGHQVPQWTPSVSYRTVELLLGRIESLSERRAFSTQPDFESWAG